MDWLKKLPNELQVSLILLIISLGTIIDYLVHTLDDRFSVAPEYFPHKIFYGVLWGTIGYMIFKKYLHTPFSVAFTISATPAVILQAMYIYKGHLLLWVSFLFMVLHFLMFLLPGYFILKKYRHLFLD